MQRHVLAGEPELALPGPDHDGGATVLLLHGLTSDTTSWAPVIDRFGDDWRTLRARLPRARTVRPRHRRLPPRRLRRRRRPRAAADRGADDRGRPLARRDRRDRARARRPSARHRGLPRGSAAVPRAAGHVPDEQLRSHVPDDARRRSRGCRQKERRSMCTATSSRPRPTRRETGWVTTSTRTRCRRAPRSAPAVGSRRDHLRDRRHDVRHIRPGPADPVPGHAGARRSRV